MQFLRNSRVDLRFYWNSFAYNYSWSSYVWLLDGWLPKCSVAIPIVGYAVLFNDEAARYLSFDRLANEGSSTFGLSSSARLKLLYLGLVFMGFANLLYLYLRPHVHKIGSDLWIFEEKALQVFLVNHYIDGSSRFLVGDFCGILQRGQA